MENNASILTAVTILYVWENNTYKIKDFPNKSKFFRSGAFAPIDPKFLKEKVLEIFPSASFYEETLVLLSTNSVNFIVTLGIKEKSLHSLTDSGIDFIREQDIDSWISLMKNESFIDIVPENELGQQLFYWKNYLNNIQ